MKRLSIKTDSTTWPAPSMRWLLLLWCLLGTSGRQAIGEITDNVDSRTLQSAGIRTLTSEHLTLYTDLPSSPDVDELPAIFDQAVETWTQFFDASAGSLDRWNVTACLIRDKVKFGDYGLLPDDLPPFLHGLQMQDRVWVYEQPGPYYRRHLLLHEGTHAAMYHIFGRVGPAWYREGIAEFLSTHDIQDGRLMLGILPSDKKLVEHWGRIRILHDDISSGNVRSIPSIVNLQARDFLKVESYAWTWALQSFASRHPEFSPIFHQLKLEMRFSDQSVTRRFLKEYASRQQEIDLAWSAFLSHIDYGFDSAHETVMTAAETSDLGSTAVLRKLDPARGWQSTGLRVPPDSTVDIAANTRFQVATSDRAEDLDPEAIKRGRAAQKPVPWVCEPQGVTIEYYQQRPLGMLMAAIVHSDSAQSGTGFLDPTAVGRRGQVTTKSGGTLFLRINERTDRMGDNAGEIAVHIRLAK